MSCYNFCSLNDVTLTLNRFSNFSQLDFDCQELVDQEIMELELVPDTMLALDKELNLQRTSFMYHKLVLHNIKAIEVSQCPLLSLADKSVSLALIDSTLQLTINGQLVDECSKEKYAEIDIF